MNNFIMAIVYTLATIYTGLFAIWFLGLIANAALYFKAKTDRINGGSE